MSETLAERLKAGMADTRYFDVDQVDVAKDVINLICAEFAEGLRNHDMFVCTPELVADRIHKEKPNEEMQA